MARFSTPFNIKKHYSIDKIPPLIIEIFDKDSLAAWLDTKPLLLESNNEESFSYLTETTKSERVANITKSKVEKDLVNINYTRVLRGFYQDCTNSFKAYGTNQMVGIVWELYLPKILCPNSPLSHVIRENVNASDEVIELSSDDESDDGKSDGHS